MTLITPGLFLGGSLLIAAPIIIHLLNRRQFKVLDWAAMDFLLEANRSNRRRIRLEDLLLLLLRCAAVLLIALLVARPYLTVEGGGGMFGSVRYTRVVVLDDSFSMTARSGGKSAFDDAKQTLADLVQQWATLRSGDAFTLALLSRPEVPAITAEALTEDSVGEIVEQIKQLEPSSMTARLPLGLEAVRKSLDDRSINANNLVYVLTDLRERDWSPLTGGGSPSKDGDGARRVQSQEGAETDLQPAGGDLQSGVDALLALAADAAACFLVDFDNGNTANLVIADVAPRDRVLVADVPAKFDVEVTNAGAQPAVDVEVEFRKEGSLALTETIGAIQPGATMAIQFPCTFAPPAADAAHVAPVPIYVKVSTPAGDVDDCVAADSTHYFPARLVRGVKTLVVDGDPSAVARESESFYLKIALDPPGRTVGGVLVTVVGPSEFETVTLDDYQVVFLCNLESISEPRRTTLEQWCRAGGGLVIAPGDQLFDPGDFNGQLYRQGKGVCPIELKSLVGDERQSRWVHFNVTHSNHDLLRLYEDENSPLLELVKVFRWWQAGLPEQSDDQGAVAVLARFTDANKSPAIVERRFGDGRVIAIATPLDDDWSNWPKEPGGSIYLAMMQDLVRYVARATTHEGDVQVGAPVVQRLNLGRYRRSVTLTDPNGATQSLQALPAGGSAAADAAVDDDAVWQVRYDETSEPGFYSMELVSIDQQRRDVLFAANVNVAEGDLARADRGVLEAQFEGSRIQIAEPQQLLQSKAASVRTEYWPYIIGLLAMVLCGELFLGWAIGNRRSVVSGKERG